MSNGGNTYKFNEPTKIPSWIKDKLHMKVRLYGKESWFPKAWASYIKLCRTLPVRDLPDPDGYFEQEELKHGVTFMEKDQDDSLYAAEQLADPEDLDEEEDDEDDYDFEEDFESDLEEM